MKKLAILTLLLMVLAACSQPALQTLPDAPMDSAPEVASADITPAPSVPADDYSMPSETKTKLDKGLTSVTKYFLTENFAKLSPGQFKVFGLGFTNRLIDSDNFLPVLTFKRAYDKGTNTIDSANAQQVAGWISQNEFFVTRLSPGEQEKVPVVIKVMDFADGTPAPKGTYEFELNVFHQGEYFQVDQDYSGDLTISIQVV